MQDYNQFFQQDQFSAAAGVELLEAEPGWAKTRMTVSDKHRNSLGMVHGAAIFTLGSAAFFIAANAAGKVAVGINLSISFVKSVHAGTLVAEAREIARSKRISTCEIRVLDGNGELVAQLQGTAYVKS